MRRFYIFGKKTNKIKLGIGMLVSNQPYNGRVESL